MKNYVCNKKKNSISDAIAIANRLACEKNYFFGKVKTVK